MSGLHIGEHGFREVDVLLKQSRWSRRAFLKAAAGGALVLGWGGRARGQGAGPLRLSVPPLQDSLPIGFANSQKLFEDAGLAVELVGISSNRERSSALLSNNLDGVLSDISTFLFGRVNAEADIVITSTGFELIDDSRQNALMASGFFNVDDFDGLLKRINDRPANSITVSRRTDFELVTDQLLESKGVVVNPELHYADTDDLVSAATLLIGGSVLSAVLPEPLAILSEQNELIDKVFLSKSVSNFEGVPMPPSVLVFRREVIESRQDEVALFYEVYRQTLEAINTASKDVVRETAIVNALQLFLPGLTRTELPSNFGESYNIPEFPQPRALLPEEMARVAAWAQRKNYLFADPNFEASVDFRFLEG